MTRPAPIMELTAEHADGTIYADGEGDLRHPCPPGLGRHAASAVQH